MSSETYVVGVSTVRISPETKTPAEAGLLSLKLALSEAGIGWELLDSLYTSGSVGEETRPQILRLMGKDEGFGGGVLENLGGLPPQLLELEEGDKVAGLVITSLGGARALIFKKGVQRSPKGQIGKDLQGGRAGLLIGQAAESLGFGRGFRSLSIQQRQALLSPPLTDSQLSLLSGSAPTRHQGVGSIWLPVGLALNFVIEGRPRLVPFATEEPSVIAAASHGAKLALVAGGFRFVVESPPQELKAHPFFVEKICRASCELGTESMGSDSLVAAEICRKIVQANLVAREDIYRAATHNKGIMNGVEAVLRALGIDPAPLQTAAHLISSNNPKGFGPLTNYDFLEDARVLRAEIRLPIPSGVLSYPRSPASTTQAPSPASPIEKASGGWSISESNSALHDLLGGAEGQALCGVLGSVGLAQNLAALKSLVGEGIQKGHMRLHAKNLALAQGVPLAIVENAAQYMIDRAMVSPEGARLFLTNHNS